MKAHAFNLSAPGSIEYNAADAPGHERGIDGHGRKTLARVYSVHTIKNGVAECESVTAWGVIVRESLPVATLVPYSKKATP